MKVLLSGFVPGEGRYSMLRTAQTLFQHLEMPPGSSVVMGGQGLALRGRPGMPAWRVKLQKRLLLPMSLRFAAYDILHIIDSDYAAAIPPSRLWQAVVTCHDLMPMLIAPRLEDVFSPMGLRFFQRSIARMEQAARVVCVSNFTRQCVLDRTQCPPERVTVVRQAVMPTFGPRPPAAVEAFRQEHGIGPGPLVLHVGITDTYKNIEAVLRVTARLREEVDGSIRLLKIGGQFNAEQRALIEAEGLADAIIHRTGLSEEALIAAYNAAQVLLWPSHIEGFGWPVLEAMACGLPVVCSNGGALPEVAGDAATVCAPADIDGLTAACARILSDTNHAGAMRARGLERAAGFTWEQAAREYLAVYQAVAEEASR